MRYTGVVVVLLLLSLITAAADAAVPFERPDNAVREFVGKRTETSRTWQLASGRHVRQIAAGPVQWRDRQGRWHEFALGLRAATNGWVGRPGRARVVVPEVLGRGAEGAIRVRNPAGDELRMRLLGNAVRAEVDGAHAEYRNVGRGVDLRVQVVPEGIKEDVVLRDADADRSLVYRIETDTPGARLSRTDDGRVIAKAGRRVAFEIPAPILVDAAGVVSPDADFTVRRLGKGAWSVRLGLDSLWLDDPARRWPVTVDPTANVNMLDAIDDCQLADHLWRLDRTCNTGNERLVGNGQAVDIAGVVPTMYSTLQFGDTLTLVPTDMIDSATLRLHRLDSRVVPHADPPRDWTSGVDVIPPRDDPNFYVYPSEYSGSSFPAGASGRVESNVSEIVRQWQQHELSGGLRGLANRGLALIQNDTFRWDDCVDAVGVCDWTRFASAQHPDPTKRPVLEVTSWPRAPAGSAVLSPREGELTGRFIKLQARALHSSVSGVQFQYVAGAGRRWMDVPLGALRTMAGDSLASTTIPVGGPTGDRRSEMVVWDLAATRYGEVDGPVHVRAYLDSPWFGQGGMTEHVGFRIDRTGIAKTATAAIGPGALDLVSGEFSLTQEDATFAAFLEDLTLTRTYSSRGVPSRNSDMFGPGWEGNVNPDGGELPYKNIYNFTSIEEEVVQRHELAGGDYDWEAFLMQFLECLFIADEGDPTALDRCLGLRPDLDYRIETIEEIRRWEYRYAVVEFGDGTKSTFTQVVDPEGRVSGWQPADDLAGYRLQRSETGTAGIAEFVLTEPSGGVATFRSEIRSSPNHRIQSYQQPGSTSALSYTYEPSGNRQRLTRVTAPLVRGGTPRWMEFNWTRLDLNVWRVTSARVGTGTGTGTVVAQYEYNGRHRLVRAWDPRVSPALVTEYDYDTSGLLSEVRPPGEEEWRLEYGQHAGDAGIRLMSVSRDHPGGGTAVNTVRYGVPLTGTGAPYEMGAAETARWAQNDDRPWDAVAIFPADDVPARSRPDYSRATIHYLNLDGREVNVARPGGAITTVEYDANGNPVRELSAANRERALAAGAASTSTAIDLSTVSMYSPDGVDLVATYEPRTQIKLESGRVVTGRRLTTTHYDQGAPSGGPYHLPTSEWRAVEIGPGYRADQREVVRYGYDVPEGEEGMSGWRARIATTTTLDPAGRRLVTRRYIHPEYPLVEEERSPKAPDGGIRPEVKYFSYIGVGSRRVPSMLSSSIYGCGGLYIDGFLCIEGDGTFPAEGQFARSYGYNWLGQVTEVRSATGYPYDIYPEGRELITSYDGAGRVAGTSVAHGLGEPVPATTVTYSPTTGREVGVSAPGRGRIERVYDSNGRLSQYTDATGLATRMSYDLRGRLTSTVEDGTRTITYRHDDRDDLVEVVDPDAGGAMSATYDADGALLSETLPGGLAATMTHDVTGLPASVMWERTGGCSRDCVVLRSEVTGRDADGNITGHRTGSVSETYMYDSVNRLARVDALDLDANVCVREDYSHDEHWNRTRADVSESRAGDPCGTATPTSRAWTHDRADRVTNTGWEHDIYGRATRAPAPDSGGRGALTAAFYTDDLVRQLSLDGRTHVYDRDPLGRTTTVSSSGGAPLAVRSTSRYADDSDVPVVTSRSDGSVVREIAGPSGQLVALKDGVALTWQLRDLNGSVVATVPASSPDGRPSAESAYDPFGVVTSPTPNVIDWTGGSAGYGWLGGHQRSTEFEQFEGAGPPMEMGVRVYLPGVGRFLQVDPIDGGSANAYEYGYQNPLANMDLTGAFPMPCGLIPFCETVRWIREKVVKPFRRGTRYLLERCIAGSGWGTYFAVGVRTRAAAGRAYRLYRRLRSARTEMDWLVFAKRSAAYRDARRAYRDTRLKLHALGRLVRTGTGIGVAISCVDGVFGGPVG